jgi:hypothetical protein
MEYEGVNKLARALQKRMQDLNNPSLVLDFGGIQDDLSLKTNTFPIPIPKTDYSVLRHLSYGAAGSVLTKTKEDGLHSHSGGDHSHDNDGSHAHDVLVPEKMRTIKAGDRVLVAWVGNDAIVIDIVLSAAEVM